MISKALAEILKVKLRSKVVLTFQDIDGDITSAAYRITGFYETVHSTYDEMYLFVNQTDLQRDMRIQQSVHEIAIFLNKLESIEKIIEKVQKIAPDLSVESWRDLAPEMDLAESSSRINLIMITSIIMLALVFGIINTMLMAVLERIRDLGMLMAIGMNRVKIFVMIVLETIMLAIIGGPIGMIIGFTSVSYFKKEGIDLSFYSEGLRKFGVESVIRPQMDPDYYVLLSIVVALTAVFAAMYPAYKAIRLKPVEALRKL